MTKIELKLSAKDGTTENNENKTGEKKTEGSPCDVKLEMGDGKDDGTTELEKADMEFNYVLSQMGLTGWPMDDVTNDDCEYQEAPGMNWEFVHRISKAQLYIALAMFVCLCVSLFGDRGLSHYIVPTAAWSVFLIVVGYMGVRAGRQRCYAQCLAFAVMTAFQTLTHLTSMCWAVYAVYRFSDSTRHMRPGVHRQLDHSNRPRSGAHLSDLMLFVMLGEVLALVACVATGLIAAIGCCRGFGRLFAQQEKAITNNKEKVVVAVEAPAKGTD